LPWRVTSRDSRCSGSTPIALVNADTGRLVACHRTVADAERQRRALEANVDEDGLDSSDSAGYHLGVVDGKTKSVRAEFKADGKPGEFTALFSVFDVLDRDSDIIRKGAFVPAFEADPNPPVVWTHRWDIPPIGETLDAEETDDGARGHGKLFVSDHPVAKQVYVAMKSGALKQYSFAYEVADGGYSLREPDEDDGETSGRFDGMIRELTEFSSVFEWGPTLVGANPSTFTESGPKSMELLLGVKASDMRAWLGVRESDVDDLKRMAELAADLGSEGRKGGARNSAKDSERLQTIHDLSVANGAKCPDSSDDDEGKNESTTRDEGAVDLLDVEPDPDLDVDDVRDGE
jgi:HK97 family phage prohead protease